MFASLFLFSSEGWSHSNYLKKFSPSASNSFIFILSGALHKYNIANISLTKKVRLIHSSLIDIPPIILKSMAITSSNYIIYSKQQSWSGI